MPASGGRSLRRLERRVTQLEGTAAAIEHILPTVTPTTSPSASPSGSPSPGGVPSPTPSPQATCQGLQVALGANIQALIHTNPPRTTFCFANGVYLLSRTIATEKKFPGLDLRAGAVIDGNNGSFIGIDGPNGPADHPGTVILGGVFQHFGNADSPDWVQPVVVRRNGLVDGTEFRDNFNSGLTVQGNNARVVRVYTHHNGRYGLNVTHPCVGCAPPKGVIIEKSEIAFNNTRMLPTGGNAGDQVLRRDQRHDRPEERGARQLRSGLWWDGYNRNARVYDNVIYDNRNWGIMWELSYGGAETSQ